MKLKVVWKPECAQAVAPSVLVLLKESGLSDKATLHFSSNKVMITSLAKRKDQSESWIELDPTHAFSSTLCESLRNNQIDLAMSLASLQLVFKYVSTCLFCAMRLTKRSNEPVLRFEFNFIDAGNCLVVHDIPIEVLRPEFAWTQPALPDPNARVLLNPTAAKRLHQFIDRARLMGVSDVTVGVTESGDSASDSPSADLTLIGVCDSVKASVSIKRLTIPQQFSGAPNVSNVHLTLSGISFLLSRLLGSCHACTCVLMAADSKYVSAWMQFPNSYGSIAAVTPAILLV